MGSFKILVVWYVITTVQTVPPPANDPYTQEPSGVCDLMLLQERDVRVCGKLFAFDSDARAFINQAPSDIKARMRIEHLEDYASKVINSP